MVSPLSNRKFARLSAGEEWIRTSSSSRDRETERFLAPGSIAGNNGSGTTESRHSSKGENAVHGSDSVENGVKEIGFFFAERELV